MKSGWLNRTACRLPRALFSALLLSIRLFANLCPCQVKGTNIFKVPEVVEEEEPKEEVPVVAPKKPVPVPKKPVPLPKKPEAVPKKPVPVPKKPEPVALPKKPEPVPVLTKREVPPLKGIYHSDMNN